MWNISPLSQYYPILGHNRVMRVLVFILFIFCITPVQAQEYSAYQLMIRQQEVKDCTTNIGNLRELYEPGNFSSLISAANQAEACVDLKVGETRVTSHEDFAQESKVEQKFAVTNIGNNTYKVDIVLNFKSFDMPRINLTYNRVRTCLNEINSNPSAQDSLGRKLKINIHTPQEALRIPAEKRPPMVDINIADTSIRENSRAYQIDTECSVVLHELLHLLGLRDEYQESSNGHYKNSLTGEAVTLNPTDTEEQNKLRDIKSGVLSGFTFLKDYQCRTIPQKNTIMKNNYSLYKDIFTADVKDSTKLLYEPAHIERIIYPKCSSRAKKYIACSKDSYKTAGEVCVEKPSYCTDDSWLVNL